MKLTRLLSIRLPLGLALGLAAASAARAAEERWTSPSATRPAATVTPR